VGYGFQKENEKKPGSSPALIFIFCAAIPPAQLA
jgi:hypothetical protein